MGYIKELVTYKHGTGGRLSVCGSVAMDIHTALGR